MTGARKWGFGQVEMKTGLTVSGIGHVAVLVWCLIVFVAKPYESNVTESMPVDIISESQFSQLTAGAKNAPQKEESKPLVEKVGEKKLIEEPEAKVDKKEITSSTDKQPPPPPPEPKQSKQADKKQAEPKRDLIAEALKKDEAKKPEQKKAEAKPPPPMPKRPPPPEAPAFDPRQLQALLDKRAPQRTVAVGDVPSDRVALGAPNGHAAQLSQNEMDALRARLAQLWNPPVGAKDPEELVVKVRIQLNRDGTLAAAPMATNFGRRSQLSLLSLDSAVRAIVRGQPFNMLRQETYEQWKDIEITFDPRDMFRS